MSLPQSIHIASTALRSLTPSELNAQNLESVRKTLEGINISELLHEYARNFPPRPEEEERLPAHEKILQEKADDLNRLINPLKEALEEIKKIRNTLNIAELDPVIQAAQKVVRPLFNFTASIQE